MLIVPPAVINEQNPDPGDGAGGEPPVVVVPEGNHGEQVIDGMNLSGIPGQSHKVNIHLQVAMDHNSAGGDKKAKARLRADDLTGPVLADHEFPNAADGVTQEWVYEETHAATNGNFLVTIQVTEGDPEVTSDLREFSIQYPPEQTVAIGQASSSATAQALTHRKRVAIGQASSSATAQAVAGGVVTVPFRAANAGSGTSQLIPATCQVGDIVIAAHLTTDGTPTPPAGFTQLQVGTMIDGQFGIGWNLSVYYRIVQSGDPGTTFAIDTSGGTYHGQVLAAYRGVAASPIDESATGNNTLVMPSVTTDVPFERVVTVLAGHQENGGAVYSWSAPGSGVSRVTAAATTHGGLFISDEWVAAAGATGTRTFACSRGSVGGVVVALKPA